MLSWPGSNSVEFIRDNKKTTQRSNGTRPQLRSHPTRIVTNSVKPGRTLRAQAIKIAPGMSRIDEAVFAIPHLNRHGKLKL